MFRFIILIVALVAGGGAAWIAWSMRGESPAPAVVQVTPAVATRDVLVAEIDLAQGQTITKESVRWQAWPESAAQPTYISRSARPDARPGQRRAAVLDATLGKTRRSRTRHG